ncbi:hypothetical protein [Arenibacter certesii]|uniref:Uncharacterized protein n=1 Tax=Arenibacter certesii TaxID=228955 RepID=A0A918J034_9FLAO|nr:hypothetical protein [Arenibacter certesii]GGW41117.1 hypothetical protein GCM10007383_27330 [Arenibacter certesii]
MKNFRIWMDKKKAHIVRLAGQHEGFGSILSEFEFYRPSGGSGTKSAKWRPPRCNTRQQVT